MRTTLAAMLLLAMVSTPVAGRAEELSNRRPTWLSLKQACEDARGTRPEVCALVRDGLPSAEDWKDQGRAKGRSQSEGDKALVKGLAASGGQVASTTPVSESAVAWGVTQFVMSRAEAELRLWLVDRVFDTICGQRAGEDVALLPETCALRDKLHLTGIAVSPGLLRNAVERDLTSLPVVVLGAAVTEQPERVKVARETAKATDDALKNARAALKDAPAGAGTDVLSKAVKEAEAKAKAARAELSRQLAATESTAVAYQVAVVVRTMLQTGDPREAYAALADLGVQKTAGDDAKVAGWIETSAAVVSTLHAEDSAGVAMWPGEKDWGYVLLSVSLDREAGRFTSPAWPKHTLPTTPEELAWQHELVTGLKKLFTNAEDVRAKIKTLKSAPAQPQADGKRASTNAKLIAEVVAASLQGAEALAEVVGGKGLTEKQKEALVLAREVMQSLASGDYLAASGQLVTLAAQGMKPGKAQRLFIRGTSMALEVAGAQDSAGVEAALNRYAAPAGSYVGKHRGDDYYLGVNAYFGLALALELARQDQGSWSDAKWGKLVGVWAPVGIELGKSTPYGSFGLFGQVLDVGVLASWRMKTTDSDQLASPPAVGIRQIVSPGGYFVWGWPGQPISVAAGAAISPSLREVGGDSSKQRDAWRFGINIALDIPVFP